MIWRRSLAIWRAITSALGLVLSAGLAEAGPARPLTASERALAEATLADLPQDMRAGLEVEVWVDRPCSAEPDPFLAVTVDLTSGRVGLCDGGEAPARRLRILFAAFLIWDDRAGWSREPAWHRHNGWSRELARPWRWTAKNLDPLGYGAPAGRRSPSWDLAIFAAAWVTERASRARAPDEDGPLECRLLPQATFLHGRLRSMGAVPPVLRPAPLCRAFEAWADRGRLDRIEIALATPSTITVASMFGHVFLRLVSRNEPVSLASMEDRTLAFLVESNVPLNGEPLFALKGIAGAYQATLVERSFLETYRTYLVLEGRDLRRFRLHLSPSETEALLRRLWSLRQAGRYRYFFFGTNCATLMVDSVNSVLPDHRQIRFPEALATTPAGTLEGYSEARSADGSPLLSFIPETFLSFEHEARRAADRRQRLAVRLREALGPEQQIRLDTWWRDIVRGPPEARAAGYRGLVTLPFGSGSGADDLRDFLRQSATVETHLQTLQNLEAEKPLWEQRLAERRSVLARLRLRLGRKLSPPGCVDLLRATLADTADDDRAARLRGYAALRKLLDGDCAGDEALADDLRRLALLESEKRADDPAMDRGLRKALFFPEPSRTLGEQRYLSGMAELIDYPFVTRISPALRAVQQAGAAASPPVRSPDRLRQEEVASRQQEEAAAYRTSVPRTGIDELEVGAGLDRSAGGLLVLAGALHDERLGDQRRFGFPPHTALTVLRTRSAWAGEGLAAWEARLVGYRSLPPRLAGTGRGPRWGGEVHADLAGRARMGRSTEARVGGGWLLPVLASPKLADHLILSGGLLATFDRITRQSVWGIGASAGLEARLSLDPENRAAWVAARAAIRPLWTTAGPARGDHRRRGAAPAGSRAGAGALRPQHLELDRSAPPCRPPRDDPVGSSERSSPGSAGGPHRRDRIGLGSGPTRLAGSPAPARKPCWGSSPRWASAR